MKEMTALEYLKEKARMTKDCSIECLNCPLYRENNSKKLMCGTLEAKFPELAVEIVRKWAEENPRKTILQDFLEKFPKALLYDDNGIPRICPGQLGYQCGKCGEPNMDCFKCWTRPLGEE